MTKLTIRLYLSSVILPDVFFLFFLLSGAEKWNFAFGRLYFPVNYFQLPCKLTPSNKTIDQVRIFFGLLFFVLYFGNLSVPLLHHLEVSRNFQFHAVQSCGEYQSHHAGYSHDKDSCSICLNSLYNHFFETAHPLAASEQLPAYRDPCFIEAHLLQKRYFHFCQARAPPTLFAFM